MVLHEKNHGSAQWEVYFSFLSLFSKSIFLIAKSSSAGRKGKPERHTFRETDKK